MELNEMTIMKLCETASGSLKMLYFLPEKMNQLGRNRQCFWRGSTMK